MLLHYEFSYLAVAEQRDIAVCHTFYLSLHYATEEAVAESENFLVRVFATHFVNELVGAFLH